MADVTWIGGASGSAGDVSVAANWSGGSVPTTGDTVFFNGAVSNQNVDEGLSGSGTLSGVALTAVYILDTFTGTIGTADTPLKINPGDLFIHYPSGQSQANGSGRINLDLEAVACDVNIYGSKSSGSDSSLPPIRIIGTNASNTLNVTGSAKVGIAITDDEEVATFATVNTTQSTTGQTPTLTLGRGCTLTTINVGAGTVTNRGANVTTLRLTQGAYTALGSATHTTVNVRGGSLVYSSSGTVTTLTVERGGTADFSRDPRAKTVTNCTVGEGGKLNLDNGNPLSITLTNGIDLDNCGVEDVTLTTGPHVTVSLSSI